jgi:hypothetical protein
MRKSSTTTTITAASLQNMNKDDLVALLLKVAANSPTADDNETEDIRPDEYIRVMSLCPMALNLSTQPKGRGKVIRFTRFGEVKSILYSQLVDIIDINTSFVQSGMFYIMNKKVVRKHGLDEVYAKILTKEQFEEIVAASSDDAIELYRQSNGAQRENINVILIAKVRDGEIIDLNFVSKISKIGGVDIMEKAKEAISFMADKD